MKTKRTSIQHTSRKRKKSRPDQTIDDLLALMARLRSESGCPWDREQDQQSLTPFLIEEAYETVEAIESGTPDALKEELGDLLLQIVFLSRIAEERKEFAFSDVVDALAKKLIHRHPHVFGSSHEVLKAMAPKTAPDVLSVWGAAKKLEGKYAARQSLLDGIPLALPALERARKISQKVSRLGVDLLRGGTPGREIEKGVEALKGRGGKKALEERLGGALLRLSDWARSHNVSAEEALRKANRRFEERFRKIETELRERGKRLEDSEPREIEMLWGKVRRRKKTE